MKKLLGDTQLSGYLKLNFLSNHFTTVPFVSFILAWHKNKIEIRKLFCYFNVFYYLNIRRSLNNFMYYVYSGPNYIFEMDFWIFLLILFIYSYLLWYVIPIQVIREGIFMVFFFPIYSSFVTYIAAVWYISIISNKRIF